MNNIEIISKEACFSCRSCEQSCPKKCIQMLENEEGFLGDPTEIALVKYVRK